MNSLNIIYKKQHSLYLFLNLSSQAKKIRVNIIDIFVNFYPKFLIYHVYNKFVFWFEAKINSALFLRKTMEKMQRKRKPFKCTCRSIVIGTIMCRRLFSVSCDIIYVISKNVLIFFSTFISFIGSFGIISEHISRIFK